MELFLRLLPPLILITIFWTGIMMGLFWLIVAVYRHSMKRIEKDHTKAMDDIALRHQAVMKAIQRSHDAGMREISRQYGLKLPLNDYHSENGITADS